MALCDSFFPEAPLTGDNCLRAKESRDHGDDASVFKRIIWSPLLEHIRDDAVRVDIADHLHNAYWIDHVYWWQRDVKTNHAATCLAATCLSGRSEDF